ncbi:MAG TPA: DUF3159 domain-containing protein [Rhodoglobus sp.]|nr:DUF3159 domain-containing protein [Rhodoglobus sp.]HPG75572.1 DUF3159 domain-containing protein [Rhodoglobus sp.]HPM51362.1 DUF3159 domain-containing protein [Rhodoglobus sp.]
MTDEQEESTPPSIRDSFAAAARRSGLGKVAPGENPSGSALLAAMGGVRGLVESILPGLGFLVVYTITQQLLPSVLFPLGLAVIFVLVRVVARQPWTSAVAGVVGIALSAGLALLTGRAEDNFVFGFLINAAFLLALLISLAARWPLIGVIASLITGEGSTWRQDRAKVKVAVIATVLWCGLFGLRLAVELPLYFAGNTQALATLKLILGVPLYAALLWVTWLLVRTAYARPEPE